MLGHRGEKMTSEIISGLEKILRWRACRLPLEHRGRALRGARCNIPENCTSPIINPLI